MDLQAFLAAPYNRRIYQNDDGSWSADVAELEGVLSGGDSYVEAFTNLHEAMELWFEVETEAGRDIPAPWGSTTHSGKLNLRLPSSLHAQAAYRAKIEGVSLNHLLMTAVSAYVEQPPLHYSDQVKSKQWAEQAEVVAEDGVEA